MSDPESVQPEHEVLPPDTSGALSVPPPVPQKKPGFIRRLFMSRKKQQAIAMQNGYLEMVDLIRAIRSHLDRQETVQTSVLAMLEKVPGAMDRQHEVMTLFKQQLESGMENNRRLTESMGNLNNTLASMDESQRAASRTITDLIGRSRESEQLLREVMRRSERRMTFLLVVFFLLVAGLGLYLFRWQRPPPAAVPETAVESAQPARLPESKADSKQPAEKSIAPKPVTSAQKLEPAPTPSAEKGKADKPVPAKPAAKEPPEQMAPAPGEAKAAAEKAMVAAEPAAAKQPEPTPAAVAAGSSSDIPPLDQPATVAPAAESDPVKPASAKPAKKEKSPASRKKAKPRLETSSVPANESGSEPAVGQPDLTLDQIKQVTGQDIELSPLVVPPAEEPVSRP